MSKLSGIFTALILLLIPCLAGAQTHIINFTESCCAIDEEGNVAFDTSGYLRAYALENEEGTFYACRGKSGLYALADSAGTLITGFDYLSVELAGGVCAASTASKVYYIISDGSARESEYTAFALTSGETALAITGNPNDETADTLKVVYKGGFVFDSAVRTNYGLGNFSGGLMAVMDYTSGLFGYVDADGEWAITPQYRYAGDFSNGCAIVAADDGYRLIDASGASLSRGTYSFMERGDNAVWCVSDDIVSAYGFDGSFLFSTYILGGSVRVMGSCAVLYDENIGYVYLPTGEQLFELAEGEDVFSTGGLFIIRDGTSSRLTDGSGQTLAGPYASMEFVSGLVGAKDESGLWALISPDGSLLTGFEFDEIASDGEIYVGRTGENYTVIPFSH